MNKKILLSVTAFVTISSSLQGADDLKSMFSDGKASGEIRAFSISRSVDTTTDYTRKSNALGGHLKYESASLNGLSLGVALYTTNGIALRDNKTDYTVVDPTLLGQDNESYSILGEAYVQYVNSNTTLKVGRQKLDTPMASSDDARMLPNLFQAYVLTNKDIPDTTILAAHVTHFAQGTFGRVYHGAGNGAAKILSATSGYSVVDTRDTTDSVNEFQNMGTYAVGTETDGVSIISATYSGVKNLKLQAWDFYAYDILNALYLQADLNWNCLLTDAIKPFASAQYIKEDDVGDRLLKNIGGTGGVESNYWATKVGAKVENFTADIAYSQASKNSATNSSYANATITPWGGMSAFTQGMVTRHQFLAGTDAIKYALSYDWKNLGANVTTSAFYVEYDMAEHNGYTFGDASESGFDIIYNNAMIENLQLRLRANYADDYNVATNGVTTSWDEYRFIVTYKF